MLLQTTDRLDESQLQKLNHDLSRSIYAPLGIRGYLGQQSAKPIEPVRAGDAGIDPLDRIPLQKRIGHFYWVHLHGRYYGIGYENGDILGFINVAEWLEYRIPGAGV